MSRALALGLVLVASTLAGCASPTGEPLDSDGDRLPDEVEVSPRSISVLRPDGETTLEVTSDPKLADTDGDGLSDRDEFLLGTDPRSLDTDGDGLLDGRSITAQPGTDLHARLVAAGIHTARDDPTTFLGEASICEGGDGLNPTQHNSDRPLVDGLGDGEEAAGGWNVTVRGVTTFVQSSPCVPDTDSDGLADDLEKAAGTDPTKRDTDGDSTPDRIDADPLANLGLRLTLDRVTQKTPRNPLGDDVRFIIQSGQDSRTFTAKVGASTDVRITFASDSDDATAEPGRLPTQVTITALYDVAGNPQPMRIAGSGHILSLTYDLMTGEWSTQAGAKGRSTGTSEGEDATVAFSLATTRS
ncbi:MAG TPA: hypothetical protein VM889_01270 [Candidatus Thermoplasmatota archaeon]|nr:hypothetical protein [Candidatus Thermoplasmatota archaeon]